MWFYVTVYITYQIKARNLHFFLDWDFSEDDINDLCRLTDQKISGITCTDKPEINIDTVHGRFMRNSSYKTRFFRYRNKNGYFLTVTTLDGQFVIARVVKPHRTWVNNTELTSVLFVIIDDSTGQVLQDLFHGRISGSENWAFHNLNFETITSCNGQYIIVVGPSEQNYAVKTAKITTRKESFVLRINVSIKLDFFIEMSVTK